MEEGRKVYCKDCERWYGKDIDQCEIPSCGIEFTQHIYNEEEYKKN